MTACTRTLNPRWLLTSSSMDRELLFVHEDPSLIGNELWVTVVGGSRRRRPASHACHATRSLSHPDCASRTVIQCLQGGRERKSTASCYERLSRPISFPALFYRNEVKWEQNEFIYKKMWILCAFQKLVSMTVSDWRTHTSIKGSIEQVTAHRTVTTMKAYGTRIQTFSEVNSRLRLRLKKLILMRVLAEEKYLFFKHHWCLE